MKKIAMLAAAAVLAMLGALLMSAPTASAEDAPNGYPYCNNSGSDPDGDGWGWEDEQSCIVRGGPADSGSGGNNGGSSDGSGGSGGYPYCNNSGSDPDGDGWGWENEQSCIVRGGPADSGSGGSTGGGGNGGSTGGGSGQLTCPSGASCGSYTVNGLGARKQAIRNAGGDALDVAIAMLETENMSTNYAYGDNKTNDAANFGLFKQNWHMLRNACSQFRGQSVGDWNNGAALNSNINQDVSCLNQSQSHYGIDRWFAGHRNGETGLNNPNTSDIQRYKTAVYWMRDQLNSNSANLSNDTRFWVDVPAI